MSVLASRVNAIRQAVRPPVIFTDQEPNRAAPPAHEAMTRSYRAHLTVGPLAPPGRPTSGHGRLPSLRIAGSRPDLQADTRAGRADVMYMERLAPLLIRPWRDQVQARDKAAPPSSWQAPPPGMRTGRIASRGRRTARDAGTPGGPRRCWPTIPDQGRSRHAECPDLHGRRSSSIASRDPRIAAVRARAEVAVRNGFAACHPSQAVRLAAVAARRNCCQPGWPTWRRPRHMRRRCR